jgi:hypothetical protein
VVVSLSFPSIVALLYYSHFISCAIYFYRWCLEADFYASEILHPLPYFLAASSAYIPYKLKNSNHVLDPDRGIHVPLDKKFTALYELIVSFSCIEAGKWSSFDSGTYLTLNFLSICIRQNE